MEEDTVYVAVGKDVNESMLTLSWALRNFGGDNFCILHVHQLPQTIASCKALFDKYEAKEAVQLERKYLQKILDNTFSFVTKDSGQLHSQLAHIALRCCDIEPSKRPDLVSEAWRVLKPLRATCGASVVILDRF
ncbi:hypothetical protein LWI29_012873 [Acer saccharum]|uniref:RING-type E3 ubiquitin transferase n=1 Tax=Acer saccharum TaxID=4024 RepID=A0AA39RWD2_ACESA|nr:hypothetical protein LWI29_012873 [Acer saccharum]